jgi:hypothetical protein
MGFLSSVRNAILGPPRIQGSDDPAAVAAALHEEYARPDPGESASTQDEQLSRATATAPFSGAGQVRAAEVEVEIVKAEDVKPDENEIEPERVIEPDRPIEPGA